MGRKKGGKNSDTDLKSQEIIQKKLKNPEITGREIAQELGIAEQTVSERLKRAVNSTWAQEIYAQARENHISALKKCDRNLHQILDHQEPTNFANQIKIMTSLYRTYGLWTDQPVIQTNNFMPIRVSIENEQRIISVSGDQSSPETGSSVQERE